MRVSFALLVAVLSAGALAVPACGSNKAQTTSSAGGSGAGGGSGGGGGAGGTTSTTSTSTVTDAGIDVDHGMVSTTYPAPHQAAPQVIWGGGPVLTAPKLVPVFFANDDMNTVAALTDFDNKIGATNYFMATTSEYGASAAVTLPAVMLTEDAPSQIDDSAIQTWLAGKLDANDPAWPAPDANTLYLIHYPSTTGITQSTQGQVEISCQEFGGYHNSTQLDAPHGGIDVPYAVLPRCPMFYPATAAGTPQTEFTGINAATGPESHEIIEATTDPFPLSGSPAYVQPDENHLYWYVALGGGEVGDMCQAFPHAFNKFLDLPSYLVQRGWSNQAAKAGQDPCVPAIPGEVYFNSATVLNDALKVPELGTIKGVKIPVGSTGTVEIDLFSAADTGGPWDVSVVDLSNPPTMDLSLDRSSGQNGEKIYLTITVNAKDPQGFAIFQLISSLGQTETLWFGAVGYK